MPGTSFRGQWPTGDAGSRYKLPGPDYVAHIFVFLSSIICLLYELTLSDQVTLQLRVSLSDLVVKIFNRSTLASLGGGGAEKSFSLGPGPALGSLPRA